MLYVNLVMLLLKVLLLLLLLLLMGSGHGVVDDHSDHVSLKKDRFSGSCSRSTQLREKLLLGM